MDPRVTGPVPPPASDPRTLDVLRILGGHPLDCTIVTPTIAGIPTHYSPTRADARPHSWLCLSGDHCTGEADGVPIIWQGYLAVIAEGLAGVCVLSLGARGRDTLLALIPAPRPLAGVRVILSRSRRSTRGPVRVTISPRRAHELPRGEVDIWPTLRLLYGRQVMQYAPQARREGQ